MFSTSQLRQIYGALRARMPWLAKLLFRVHRQRLSKLCSPRGVTICADISAIRNIRYAVEGEGNILQVGEWTVIDDLELIITGNRNRIIIGDEVRILTGRFCIEDDDSELRIGSGSHLVRTEIGLTESNSKIIIGQSCMLAPGVDVRNGDSHAIFDKVTHERINRATDIVLGDRVWVGVRAIILKGAKVPDGCIIGACSLVAKCLPEPDAIYVGSPPRLLRNQVSWTHAR